MKKLKLFLIIPCYNEEDVLPITSERIQKKMETLIKNKIISSDSKIVFINDGSNDNTWNIIKKLNKNNKLFSGINLLKNYGHQNALLAGLITVKDECDITISMDADLQDDIECIDKFIQKYKEGNDIVYGVRKSRKSDSNFKRNTALLYYKILKFLDVNIVYNHADYRLLSKYAIEELSDYKENNLFLRGIIPQLGLKSDYVEYDRSKRVAGKTKYSLGKMINLALNGITSFSVKPIRIIALLGLIIFLISIIMLVYSLIRFISGETIVGWTSIMTSIWFIGGLLLLSVGIIGEYISKIFIEIKNRPKYKVKQYLR